MIDLLFSFNFDSKVDSAIKHAIEEGIDYRGIFETLDRDSTGTVRAEDLTDIFKELGVVSSRSEMNQLKLQFDVNGDGRFGYVEFLRAIKPSKGISKDLWQVCTIRGFNLM